MNQIPHFAGELRPVSRINVNMYTFMINILSSMYSLKKDLKKKKLQSVWITYLSYICVKYDVIGLIC